MKFLYILLLLLPLNSTAKYMPIFEDEIITLDKKLELLKVEVYYKKDLEIALNYCHIDNNLILAFIMVESSFKINSYNKKTKDFGLMQINHYHVKKLKLDKNLLLSNAIYNIEIGCNILGWFLKTYEFDDAIKRYNVGTRRNAVNTKQAIKYHKSIIYWYKKLNNL